MSIGYRSFLSSGVGEPLIESTVKQIASWMHAKGIGTPVERAGRYVNGQNDIISVLHEDTGDGRIFRWRREHPQASAATQMWRTTVTAAEYPDRPGWIWTEIELSEAGRTNPYGYQSFMSVPGFLRDLIGELRCYDGRTQVSAEPQWVSSDGLPDLMDCLADESRRGAVMVASHTAKPCDELERWALDASWELAGLGVLFLLDDEVEREFNEMMGPRHAVVPGTVRTYVPSVDLDDPADPRRHRTLSQERIEYSQPKRIAHILGFAQRHRVAGIPLPEDALRTDEFLELKAEDLIERPDRSGIRLVHPVRDGEPRTHAVPSQRDPLPAEPDDVPLSPAAAGGSSQLLSLPPATWMGRGASVEELRLENAQLRHERDILTQMVRTYQRLEGSILGSLQELGGEMRLLRTSLSEESAKTRQHLNGV